MPRALRSACAAFVGLATLVAACASSGVTAPSSRDPGEIRFVALGDSYTIGVSVAEPDRWPNQLVARLREHTRLVLVANLGVNGYTSGDLIADELPQLGALQPGFVTVQIGVNDVVQGVPEEHYRQNVEAILDELLQRVAANRIVTLATPDYTVTPQGAAFGDPRQQSADIRRNNEILRAAADDRGIAYVDIYDISLAVEDDRALVATDGLHPSATQYRLWVDRIAPVVESLLVP
jgi:lysophospholipase L1-like esterase